MPKARPRRRFGGLSFLVLVTTSLANTILLRLYRYYIGETNVQQLQAKGGHELLEDQHADSTCASHNSSLRASAIALPPVSKVKAAQGDALLQVSKRKVALADSDNGGESPVPRTVQNESFIASADLDQDSSSVVQPPKGHVAITVTNLLCRTTVYSPDGVCPSECPYFAQEDGPARSCNFQCVEDQECGNLRALSPKEDIADRQLRICRKCRVVGCARDGCEPGMGDHCRTCDQGYSRTPDGFCVSDYWQVWSAIFMITGIVGIFLILWLARLHFMPVKNEDGLKEGLAYRSSLKLRVPKSSAVYVGAEEASNERPLWPLSTNLHAVQVAGPGLTLHMNFQLAIIVWGSGIIVTWVLYTYCTNPEMLVLGLSTVDTPQQLCSVTLRGKEVQRRLIPTKVTFLVLMYIFTFVFNFFYSLYQRRRFLEIDDETTMSDFAAICTGLPVLKGDQQAEDIIKKCISEATGEKVVGVSICWAYRDFEDDIADAMENEIEMLEDKPTLPDQATIDADRGICHGIFSWVDALFGFDGKVPAEGNEAQEKKNVEELIKNIPSTDSAFIVFETEASRDKAVQVATQGGGLQFQTTRINLKCECCQPDTVKWTSFQVTSREFWFKLVIGFLVIIMALMIWCFGFYFPFAYYQASFAKQGSEPGFLAAFIFSMLVVAGNQIMYFVCGEISERVGFRFSDHKETLYIALYTVACTLNLAVDMVMEFFLAYEAAIAAGVHTADGQEVVQLHTWLEVFESYPMQKAVGERLFAYCFPATFLVPFLMEPIFAIFVPYYICKLLVGTHPECRGREAEKSFEIFAPMDMGRYGDLLLDLMLCVLIVFFPPGTFLKMMLALVVCHFIVYVYDQYRILRTVPAFDYASDAIDREVCMLLGLPLSFLAAGIVFKGASVPGSTLKGENLIYAMILASVATMLIYTAMIKIVVPMFDNFGREHRVSPTPYSEAAASVSSTWFSENPVHCLRSKYIYKHEPPCMFNTRGKEHLIQKNEKCGVYFEGCDRIGDEEYDTSFLTASAVLKQHLKFTS